MTCLAMMDERMVIASLKFTNTCCSLYVNNIHQKLHLCETLRVKVMVTGPRRVIAPSSLSMLLLSNVACVHGSL